MYRCPNLKIIYTYEKKNENQLTIVQSEILGQVLLKIIFSNLI